MVDARLLHSLLIWLPRPRLQQSDSHHRINWLAQSFFILELYRLIELVVCNDGYLKAANHWFIAIKFNN